MHIVIHTYKYTLGQEGVSWILPQALLLHCSAAHSQKGGMLTTLPHAGQLLVEIVIHLILSLFFLQLSPSLVAVREGLPNLSTGDL